MNSALLTIEALTARLAQLEADLNEILGRMPAHSVKPPLMAALLELEDERDALLERLQTLGADSP